MAIATTQKPPFAINIRRLRESEALSQERLAEELGVSTTTVQGWERGAHKPKPGQRRLICSRFAVSPAQLDGQDEDVNRRQFGQFGLGLLGGAALPDPERVEHLLRLLGRSLGPDRERVAAILSGTTVDGAYLGSLQRTMDDLSTRSHTEAPASLLPAVDGHLHGILSLLDGQSDSVERALQAQAAQAGRLCGWLGFLLDDRSHARAYYKEASQLASASGDDVLVARVLVSASLLGSTVSQGHGAAAGASPGAIEMLQEAARRAGTAGPARLTSWIQERLAEETAAAGDGAAARRHLEVADRILGAGPRSEDDPLPTGWDFDWLLTYHGTVARLDSRPAEAVGYFTQALERTPPFGYDACVVHTNLGAAYAQEGRSADQAVGHLGVALLLAQKHHLPGRIERVRGAYRLLPQQDPLVTQLGEQLRLAS